MAATGWYGRPASAIAMQGLRPGRIKARTGDRRVTGSYTEQNIGGCPYFSLFFQSGLADSFVKCNSRVLLLFAVGQHGIFAFLGRGAKSGFAEGELPVGQGRSGAPQKSGRLSAHGLV